MKTVWKFPLYIDDVQDVEMPEGAEVLSVQEWPGAELGAPLVMYALVDDDAFKVRRRFRIVGTGNPADDLLPLDRFLGSVITAGGALVWHVWETP